MDSFNMFSAALVFYIIGALLCGFGFMAYCGVGVGLLVMAAAAVLLVIIFLILGFRMRKEEKSG